MPRLRILSFMLLIVAALVLLPGCWVMSVYPLYEENERQPVDPGLIGKWWQPTSDCRLIITPAQNYTGRQELAVEYSVPENGPNNGCLIDSGSPAIKMKGTLVDVEGHLFLDLLPDEPEGSFQTMPMHSVYRIELRNDELDFVPLSPGFLVKAIRAGQIQGMTDDDVPVITAPRPELRKFLVAMVDDTQAFPVVDGDRNWHFTKMPAGVAPRTSKQKPACSEN